MDLVISIGLQKQKASPKDVHAFLQTLPEFEMLHKVLSKCRARCHEKFEFSSSDAMLMRLILKPNIQQCKKPQAKNVSFMQS